MARAQIPAPPKGARSSGRVLWRDVMARYELEQHELALLREMVRCVDPLDELHAITERDGLVGGRSARGEGASGADGCAAAADSAGPARRVAAVAEWRSGRPVCIASSPAAWSCQGRLRDRGCMMRRRPVDPLLGFLFNGRRYSTPVAYRRAVDAWAERRRRLLALINRDDERGA
ncbi:hypothetical protein PJI17_27075 [Mycobacterium kansasii]|uniref:Uncharacterized protein n=4 Tax=Mycobacterium kansasii TaxID=1768 RepID=A0A653EKY5_MYCKA|nr:hypothetical protein LAUMK22_04692 [Mycobacterium kansasii]VAZ69282.1 hypothetical protein LAUMK40_05443 [Mycobacterium kansasii]VAZ80385.1 hypothetical protein LAUMK7_05320 [Mycobacterium kansasii]VTO98007.1 hypothetical protein BIN_B_01161 [Mycobacterium kansasii]BCI85263.1 hypothetical protein NIIDMKKI_04690 [Mycobacterium kansasii]